MKGKQSMKEQLENRYQAVIEEEAELRVHLQTEEGRMLSMNDSQMESAQTL